MSRPLVSYLVAAAGLELETLRRSEVAAATGSLGAKIPSVARDLYPLITYMESGGGGWTRTSDYGL